jgi:hypothetical protein
MGRFVASGFKHCDQKEFELRGKTCQACPDRNVALNQCNRCKCFLKLKIPLATEECVEWKKARDAAKEAPKT